MADKLFDIIVAAIEIIPHVKVIGANPNEIPLTMYHGEIVCDASGQIVVGFDSRRKSGLFEDMEPLASLEDVRQALAHGNRIVPLVNYDKFILAYARPFFDRKRDKIYKRDGHVEFVAVGTHPFFEYPKGRKRWYNWENGINRGTLRISEFNPDDYYDLLENHRRIFSHLLQNVNSQ